MRLRYSGRLLTALTGATAVILALTAAAAIAAADGIGVCELLTKSGTSGGVTAYQPTHTHTRLYVSLSAHHQHHQFSA